MRHAQHIVQLLTTDAAAFTWGTHTHPHTPQLRPPRGKRAAQTKNTNVSKTPDHGKPFEEPPVPETLVSVTNKRYVSIVTLEIVDGTLGMQSSSCIQPLFNT